MTKANQFHEIRSDGVFPEKIMNESKMYEYVNFIGAGSCIWTRLVIVLILMSIKIEYLW